MTETQTPYTPCPKPERYENEKYLAFIRTLPCRYCHQPAEPHHVRRYKWGAGGSQKPHDYAAVPRCRLHHGPEWEDGVEDEIIRNMMKYLEHLRKRRK